MKSIQGYIAFLTLTGVLFSGAINAEDDTDTDTDLDGIPDTSDPAPLIPAVSVPEYEARLSLGSLNNKAMDVGDLDGDGDLDLVIVSDTGARYILNDGDQINVPDGDPEYLLKNGDASLDARKMEPCWVNAKVTLR